MNENAEGPDSYHSRAKEDEAFVTSTKGPRPVANEVKDYILASTAAGLAAMTALAIAGVYGERFEYNYHRRNECRRFKIFREST